MVVLVKSRNGSDFMKIIQPGDLNKPKKTKRFTCDNCGCIFEADKTEYKAEDSGRNETFYHADCPTCGDLVYAEL